MGFNSLPLELVPSILCFLGPRDVVRLRLVSRLFRDISHDPVLWKTIYTNARVPRSPGPFPFQSTRFLEQTLIRSERLAECWTTQPLQALPNTKIRLEGPALGYPRIIFGRWFITFESSKQIVFHDLETHSQQVLWEDAGLMRIWEACSVISACGLLLYVVFRKGTGETWRAPWKLLEFRVHDQTGHVSHSMSFDVPSGVTYLGASDSLISDKTPFLYITAEHLVFDTRTRIFYEFPELDSELDEIQANQFFNDRTLRRVLLTNTHFIVVFFRLPVGLATPPFTLEWTLIQAFTLPQDADPRSASNATRALRRTHEGIISDDLANLVLIRNSTIDCITKSTNIRFLRLHIEGDRFHFSCVDLTLPRSHSDAVLPLSIEVKDIFAIGRGIWDHVMSPTGYYIEASNDGYVRGLCRNRSENDDPNVSWITKFTIDATGDECVADVGQASLPRWIPNDEPPRFSMLTFDGINGRCCYSPNGYYDWRFHGFVDVTVVDIK